MYTDSQFYLYNSESMALKRLLKTIPLFWKNKFFIVFKLNMVDDNMS